jgi:hypothetical protein
MFQKFVKYSSMKRIILILLLPLSGLISIGQTVNVNAFHNETSQLSILKPAGKVHPFDQLVIICQSSGSITVTDGKGIEYLNMPVKGRQDFLAGGAQGIQTVKLFDTKGNLLGSSSFSLEAPTNITDGGKTWELFSLLYKGMLVYSPYGYEEVTWNGRIYRYFVNWVLDNNNTMKGMQYFSPYSRDLSDLLRANQKPDGMIWSFVQPDKGDFQYYETAYSYLGYFNRDRGAWFVRQPNENHVEYNYVNMIYQHWKASGDTEWMKGILECAEKALDFCITDTLHWSKRFQLLKRPYCIDSWDFQVDDKYTPAAPLSPTMVVVPGKTKYGIFFGDNTGYYEACNQLADMLDFAGSSDKAKKYRIRGNEILSRLIALSWNGKYFTHFIDEDPAVKRDLGVDEKSQIAQGNMYSLNRGLTHDVNVAIIKTYLDLRKKLPAGSPGEWYAIYPPFEKGFGMHDEKWQYMNGGMAGHAMGEMARGAYENGYENYASGVMDTMLTIIKKYGNRLWFAYTGSFPATQFIPKYKTIDISKKANMDLWDKGGKGVFTWMDAGTSSGNDMRGLPVGQQLFHNIPFNVTDPATNQRRSVAAISTKKGYPFKVEIPINDSAAAIYLLHSSSDNIPSSVAGAIRFIYEDGTEASRYIFKGKEITNWWFSSLENEYAGVAWYGPNLRSTKVGVCWAAINNPHPERKISNLVFEAPLEGGIYALIGVTLSDKKHFIRPKGESFGGPDNWAAANGMAALVEGLAGVKNEGLAFEKVKLSPRWTSAGVDSVNVTIQFASSNGYVAYQYLHNASGKEIILNITGSGKEVNNHLLLPSDCKSVSSILIDGQPVNFSLSKIENSSYADFSFTLPYVHHVKINYK